MCVILIYFMTVTNCDKKSLTRDNHSSSILLNNLHFSASKRLIFTKSVLDHWIIIVQYAVT